MPNWLLLFRRPWRDPRRPFVNEQDLDRQRRLTYQRIDRGRFGWWVVFVAGIGFVTDAYDIFAVNMILPILGIVYPSDFTYDTITGPDNVTYSSVNGDRNRLFVSLVTLIGTAIGQVIFGVLADRYGRKRMYGWELVIVIISSVGLALASKGQNNAINILPWVIVWRLFMGIGIGADYPLSAVITSEFAPRRHRARMLATVFYMQPIGQVLGNVVAIIVTAVLQKKTMLVTPADCKGPNDCTTAADQMWRWIVGLGVIPPVIAVLFRMYIPESPRYTLEVEKDPFNAGKDAEEYFQVEDYPAAPTDEELNGNYILPDAPGAEGTAAESVSIGPSPTGTRTPPIAHTHDGPQYSPYLGASDGITAVGSHRGHSGSFSHPESIGMADFNYSAPSPNEKRSPSTVKEHAKKQSWRQFWSDFRTFLFTDGNWTDLAGTALTWLMLDLAFYFLGVNTYSIIKQLWAHNEPKNEVYDIIMKFSWRTLLSNTAGALVGGAIFIPLARFRFHLQIHGFLGLFVLFIVVGITYIKILSNEYFAAVIVIYSLCPILFNFGPNTSTFIIPAEVFPTRFRCSAHGISAAAGKCGSIIGQLFLYGLDHWTHHRIGADGKKNSAKWLGYALLANSAFMILGAVLTKIWVPNPCDINGESRSLEDLSLGKKHRLQLEADEKSRRRAAQQDDASV